MRNEEVLRDIANTIVAEVQREFDPNDPHRSITGQTANVVRAVRERGCYKVYIDPYQYWFSQWRKYGVRQIYSDKSYISYVNDVSGGFNKGHTHYHFIEKAIENAIWANGCNYNRGGYFGNYKIRGDYEE